MINSVINLLYPTLCEVCGKKLIEKNKCICSCCYSKIELRTPPFCIKCGRTLLGEVKCSSLCFDCSNIKTYLDKAISALHYNEVVKKLIHDLKYKKITVSLNVFVDIAVGFMEKQNFGNDCDVLLSVPMHHRRLFEREINISSLLAKKISKKINKPFLDHVLKKIKHTPAQASLKRNERLRNVSGSISINRGKIGKIKNKKVLLVDDLYTTGSTLNECARALKQAGSKEILALTIARGDISL